MRKAPASEGSGEAAPPCALDVPDNDTPEGRMHPLLALEEACGLAAGEWEGRMFRRDEITRDESNAWRCNDPDDAGKPAYNAVKPGEICAGEASLLAEGGDCARVPSKEFRDSQMSRGGRS